MTGANDPVQDGDVTYTIATAAAASADPFYNGINAADVAVTNTDNDVAGVTVTPFTGLTTTEAGGAATFTVVLDTQPAANVRINLSSSDTGESTLSTSRLTFTPANWNTPQVVTLTGVDDFTVDGDQGYFAVLSSAVSADTHYNGLNPANVAATNTDDDVIGVTVTPTSGLITRETGAAATFTLVLQSQPAANVTIPLSSSNTAEGVLVNPSVTFTAANWNVAQAVTVSGVDDALLDDDIAYTVLTAAATSADPLYNGFDPADVALTNIDNDSIGIKVLPLGPLVTSEAGGSVAFNVLLAKQPTANVTLLLASGNTAEGIVSRSSLTFTVDNWDVARTITVSGVNDLVDDDDAHYDLVLSVSATATADPDYAALPAKRVTITNTDDDTAGLTISRVGRARTSESLDRVALYDLVLNSQPRANVVLLIKSRDITEGEPAVSTLTFTPTNWNAPHELTIRGVDDHLDDGDIPYRVSVTPLPDNADAKYAALPTRYLRLTNSDDDTPGLEIVPQSTHLTTTEAGGQTRVTVVLRTQPTADVRVTVRSTDAAEVTVSAPILTFTSANWDTPQTIVITGVDDPVADGDVTCQLIIGPTQSADPLYDAVPATEFDVTNRDDDVAGVIVTSVALTDTAQTFEIRLGSRPAADVLVDLGLLGIAGTISNSPLLFSPEDWNLPQTVTLTFDREAHANSGGSLEVTTQTTDPAYADQRSAKPVAPSNSAPASPRELKSSIAPLANHSFNLEPVPPPHVQSDLPRPHRAQLPLHSRMIGGLDPIAPIPAHVADVHDPQDLDVPADPPDPDLPDDPSAPDTGKPPTGCEPDRSPIPATATDDIAPPSAPRTIRAAALRLFLLPLAWLGAVNLLSSSRERTTSRAHQRAP
jgi:hypothetical protein